MSKQHASSRAKACVKTPRISGSASVGILEFRRPSGRDLSEFSMNGVNRDDNANCAYGTFGFSAFAFEYEVILSECCLTRSSAFCAVGARGRRFGGRLRLAGEPGHIYLGSEDTGHEALNRDIGVQGLPNAGHSRGPASRQRRVRSSVAVSKPCTRRGGKEKVQPLVKSTTIRPSLRS